MKLAFSFCNLSRDMDRDLHTLHNNEIGACLGTALRPSLGCLQRSYCIIRGSWVFGLGWGGYSIPGGFGILVLLTEPDMGIFKVIRGGKSSISVQALKLTRAREYRSKCKMLALILVGLGLRSNMKPAVMLVAAPRT